MKAWSRIIIGLVISALYVGLNWVLVTLGGALSFRAAVTFGPASLLIGFIATVLIALTLLILYILAMRQLIRIKKEQVVSQVVHERLRSGQVYQHYKGKHYKVLALGQHSETGEETVAYQREDDGHVFFRPLSMWFEEVEWEGKQMPRFVLIRD